MKLIHYDPPFKKKGARKVALRGNGTIANMSGRPEHRHMLAVVNSQAHAYLPPPQLIPRLVHKDHNSGPMKGRPC